ncbi:hypothetical protein CEXT_410011 [Caerostris extrusa]|uniref:Secreted protein n=1 Tax=Caerostris extrusa TaxID=172846 RepID=A0AAV4XIV6_CAEEX|nr:hypothetical protein CEXT_410011 [Caerostris extrusa]
MIFFFFLLEAVIILQQQRPKNNPSHSCGRDPLSLKRTSLYRGTVNEKDRHECYVWSFRSIGLEGSRIKVGVPLIFARAPPVVPIPDHHLGVDRLTAERGSAPKCSPSSIVCCFW